MSTYYKFLLILIALAYLASPIDLIPDLFIPFLGWVDDTFLIGLVIYYLRFGKLPKIFYRDSGQRADHAQQPGSSTEQSSSSGENASQSQERPKLLPHEILEIDKNATREEIQAAYRGLVKQYHPDRVAHLGKELQTLANQKFIEIKEAYTRMMKG
ncbi:MAG: DnaJ domain-containing protein [Desulfobacterium sp.]|nr:DnaJ domain-containing protein [Desulfobacterium sp.]